MVARVAELVSVLKFSQLEPGKVLPWRYKNFTEIIVNTLLCYLMIDIGIKIFITIGKNILI